MKSARILISAVCLLSAVVAYPQTIIRWDLAEQPTRSQTVRPGEAFTVVVSNRLAGPYSLDIQRARIPIPPLDSSKLTPAAAPAPPGSCDAVVDSFKKQIAGAKSEGDVQTAVNTASSDGRAGCTEAQRISILEPLIADLTRTTIVTGETLAAGEQLTVQMSRGTGTDAKKFTLTLSTGPAAEWLTSYGFNYVPRNDETYYLRPRSDGKYDIVREADTNDYDFVPGVLFSVFPTAYKNALGLRFGGAVGFGFASKDPVAFLGPALNVGQNVTLVTGLVMRPEKRLNPRLDQSVPVSDNLSDEQLHHEGYHPNWFFGIGVNFSGNPFKSAKPAESGGDTKGKEQ